MVNRKTRRKTSRKTSRKTNRKRGGDSITPTFYKNDPRYRFDNPPPVQLGDYFNRRFRIIYNTGPDEPMINALGRLKRNGFFSLDTDVNDASIYLPRLHSYQLEEIDET